MSEKLPPVETMIAMAAILNQRSLPKWLQEPANRADFDAYLAEVAEELLPHADRLLHANAVHRRVARWLADHDPRIFSFVFQGSIAMGTVIAHGRKDQVDLDEYARYTIKANGLGVCFGLGMKPVLICARS